MRSCGGGRGAGREAQRVTRRRPPYRNFPRPPVRPGEPPPRPAPRRRETSLKRHPRPARYGPRPAWSSPSRRAAPAQVSARSPVRRPPVSPRRGASGAGTDLEESLKRVVAEDGDRGHGYCARREAPRRGMDTPRDCRAACAALRRAALRPRLRARPAPRRRSPRPVCLRRDHLQEFDKDFAGPPASQKEDLWL